MHREVWITQFFLCDRIFCCLPPYYAVGNHPHLFKSFVQTMLKLISLHHRQALTDTDGASNNKIDFHKQYLEILNLEGYQNCISWSTSLLRRLQAQTLPYATLPIGQIHPFSKMAVNFEPLMGF